MVEFAVVLMAKQRADWNEKARANNNKIFVKNQKKSDMNSQMDESSDDTGPANRDNIPKNDHILDNFKLTKEMPPYRKMDVASFVVFTGLYFCFNYVYFVICVKY